MSVEITNSIFLWRLVIGHVYITIVCLFSIMLWDWMYKIHQTFLHYCHDMIMRTHTLHWLFIGLLPHGASPGDYILATTNLHRHSRYPRCADTIVRDPESTHSIQHRGLHDQGHRWAISSPQYNSMPQQLNTVAAATTEIRTLLNASLRCTPHLVGGNHRADE